MTIKNVLFIVFISMALTVQSQSYTFSVLNEPYSDLVGSISLNEGMVWDDPGFEIPIGFDFQYFNETINKIYIDENGFGGMLSTDISGAAVSSLLVPYSIDIIDIGYDIDQSLSPISYLLEGGRGQRILKIEWKNVGFWDDSTGQDFTNFQLWLYEGTNDIEVHFGENSISQPDDSFEGSTVAFLHNFNDDNEDLTEGLILEGDPVNPTVIYFSSVEEIDDANIELNGPIPNGTVYRFSKMLSGTSELYHNADEISVYPNPSSDFFKIVVDNEVNTIINTISISNSIGQLVKTMKYDYDRIDISDLSAGIYTVEVYTNTGMISKKFVKK